MCVSYVTPREHLGQCLAIIYATCPVTIYQLSVSFQWSLPSVILSYPILSYPILSYPILSYPILPAFDLGLKLHRFSVILVGSAHERIGDFFLEEEKTRSLNIIRIENLAALTQFLKSGCTQPCDDIPSLTELNQKSMNGDESTCDSISDFVVPLVGIEISPSAYSVCNHMGAFACSLQYGRTKKSEEPTSGTAEQTAAAVSIAFMPGNEGSGLNSKQKAACNSLVYIPQVC